jgi:hypothetical protein
MTVAIDEQQPKMLVQSLLALALLASTALADGTSIVAAITTIAADTIALNDTVAALEGFDLIILGEITVQSTKLLIDIDQGTGTARASANLTFSEALDVATATQALVGDVQSTLTTIRAKKSVFQHDLVQGIILLNLLAEKSATDTFGAAVVAKLPAALQAVAGSLLAPVDSAFSATIADYEQFF